MEMLKANRFTMAVVLLGGVFSSLAWTGCSGQRPAAAQSQSSAATANGDIPDVLATIGDEQITLADIRARVGADLDKNETRYRRGQHRLIENTLQEIIRERVLLAEAKKRNLTVDELVAAETGSSPEPTEAEVVAWYKANASRTGGRALDQIRPQILDFLRADRRKEAVEKLEQRLNEESKVTVNLVPFTFTFNNEGAPTLGPASAKVTLVEFSDFQCPFCKKFFPILKQVEQNFGDKVQIIYRQYPIPSLHPNAFKAAEASLCAHDQGKFWELHDLMFQEQDRLAVKDLKVAAARLGMDQKKFDLCLDSGRYTEQVQNDMDEGGRVGVTGTPSLFLNGVPLDGGAVPYEKIAKAIEKELARTAR